MSDILNIVHSAGATAEELSRKESWALLQTWRGVYCAPVQASTGKWVGSGGCSWHTFSHDHAPCLKGSRALAQYAAQPAVTFLVLTEGGNDLGLRCGGSALPDFSGLLQDVYVAPPSFDWTMVFTHEYEAFGPYFSRADWLCHGMSSSR